ncbi:MAG TPA: fatty acid desaturase [Methylibium sp.]|uniref:fatty acid desaturase n=1 Tax=Methylibium sp. TaxID=2067992 RepID=UPI002DBA0B2A|nr:fatty acid desaturase [Methylibium sp.]HEU4457852.1 fatty acid desaturase [Methylibium sp.]
MTADARVRDRRLQSAAGLGLAALIVGAWLATQYYALFVHAWTGAGLLAAPVLVAFICWLDVGLFIVGHDAIHGSLAPASRPLNRAVGRLGFALYAGFSLGRFEAGHHAHHRAPGTDGDPDFHPHDGRFWPWYRHFLFRYFGWHEVLGLAVSFALIVGVLRAPMLNALVFWALPALLSSVQLFAFGTWLPHRVQHERFIDEHRARSSGYGHLASLLSCFHFGYHHEHHLRPDAPWWRLPAVRRTFGARGKTGGVA